MSPDFFGSRPSCSRCGTEGGPLEIPTADDPEGLETAVFRQVARRQSGAALRLLLPWPCPRCAEQNMACSSRGRGGEITVHGASREAPEESAPHYVATMLWALFEEHAPECVEDWRAWGQNDSALWKCLEQGGTLAALQKCIFHYNRADLLHCYWGLQQALGDLLLSAELSWERSDAAVYGWAHLRVGEGRRATDAACADPQLFLLDEEETALVTADRLAELEVVYQERYGNLPGSPQQAESSLSDDIFVPSPYGSLHPVGYFRELPYGDPDGPSLQESIRQEAAWEEEKLLTWLESGIVVAVSPQVSVDYLHPDRPVIGPLRLLSDGACVWSSDLIWYVRHYHVRLPEWFGRRARSLGWKMPRLDAAGLSRRLGRI